MPKTAKSPSKPTSYSPYNRPITSGQQTSLPTSAEPTSSEYVFNFGKYKGKTLHECHSGYISWLIREDVASHKPDLKKALELYGKGSSSPAVVSERGQCQATSMRGLAEKHVALETESAENSVKAVKLEVDNAEADTSSAALHHIESEPNSSMNAVKLEETEYSNSILRSVKEEVDPPTHIAQIQIKSEPGLSDTNQTNPTQQHNPNPYVLDFGKHRGSTLSEVPLTYISFLARECIERRPILKKALIDEGFLNPSTGQLHSPGAIIKPEPQPPATTVSNKKEPPAPFILDFGKHSGSKLSEVPLTYILFLAKECKKWRPLLNQALIKEGYINPSSEELITVRTMNWRPPPLFLAPAMFKDGYDDLWIGRGDLFSVFQIPPEFLEGLPLVRGKKRAYYLYHVYEFLKHHHSPMAANVALAKWLDMKEDRMEDIWAGMGLGVCLL